MMRKNRIRQIDRVLEKIVMLFFLLVFAVGLYITVDTAYVYQSASSDALKRWKPDPESEESGFRLSDDAVAWLTLEDTGIDYPVMQADNNEEYLNKDPEGNYSPAGSIFMDFRNRSDFSDPYVLLYGHHMAEGLMFGALDRFSDLDYFKRHRNGTLISKEKQYALKTVAFLTVHAGCDEVFAVRGESFDKEFLDSKAAIYDPEAASEQLMALTTCHPSEEEIRTVLLVSLTEIKA